ncbi:hypothetical protein [Enterococcus faecalis]|jgi:hypothetical protein|uniref:hypothetical protein n=1 Tax=Enterococcus faecalis TaxID=1351 RepID=UPI000A193907|nr:hypothetical protein [Enterococcus faecalis]EGO5981624.1 hypothetical protein [Enterococcus faecalis]MDU6565712.1 hypothetical protein [Enterococcus faecalis]OSH08171.1 hypothetical protein EFDM72_2417 [Enterococcus faecalis]HCY9026042.1 hypothetical protein [Enterococcus faecalis]
MDYKNTKTGATISSSCIISGGDWIIVDKKEKNPNKMTPEEVVSETEYEAENIVSDDDLETGDAAYDAITAQQIKQELDAFGIDYNKSATKRELYNLMMAQGK